MPARSIPCLPGVLSICTLLATFPLTPGARCQAQAEGERNRRLEEVEKRLRDLLKEIESLRLQWGPAAAKPQDPAPAEAIPPGWLKALNWRPIGPANMGGRIVDLAVCESDPSTFWVATASGGLLKTTNNGVTFEHQFDKEATVSIGAVAVAPSDPKVVWVGTGENNPRNSVSYGDGVYRSVDGGKSWKNVGLKKTFQIGRIVIHPKDPNTVYVGALGRLYGPSDERGVFKTRNGGETWEKQLYLDDRTGVIDLSMHPGDPENLIAALWERQRDGFDSWPGNEVQLPEGHDRYDPIKKWGPGSGLHKTTDGGKTWRKLTRGLPPGQLGRIGIDWHRKDPKIVFAVIDCENIGKGPEPLPAYFGAAGEDAEGRARVTQVQPESPAARAGLQAGDVITAAGDKPIAGFDQALDHLRGLKPGQKVTLKVARGSENLTLEVALRSRPGSGRGIGPGGGGWLGLTGEGREGKTEVTEVVPDGPAAKAGLAPGDLLAEIDGKPITDFEEIVEQVRGRQAGDKVTFRVSRGRETKEIVVELEDRPAEFGGGGRGPQAGSVYLGIQGEDAEGGARLTEITDDGPAEKAGLQAGDVIQSVEGKKMAEYEDLVEEIRARKAGDKVTIGFVRGGETRQAVATLENRPGGPTRVRPYSFSLSGQSPNVQDQQGTKGAEYGGVYRSDDGGESWIRVNSLNSRPMYFSHLRVDPNDPKLVYVLGVSQYRSSNGGVTFQGDFGRGVHADGHVLWIDPRDGRHLLIGCDGGTYVTYDAGANWDHLNHVAIGQFYHVAISPKYPYYVTGGLQDNGTWAGPSLGLRGAGPINEDWISVGGGDGFQCQVDPNDPDLFYFTSQDGNMARRNLQTGERASIRPVRPRGSPIYRFNWNTPFILSRHNSRIFYCAGNYVFRSLDRGDDLRKISPEITLTKRGSATCLAESPRDPDLLYAGTDDGALWVTRDGGREWTEISKSLGIPAPRWVATIEASRFEAGRVYLALDGHRSDDDQPHLFASEDSGKTWRSLRANLPWGSTRCLREDLKNQDLLFAGTEFGAWFSVDRGKAWHKLDTNFPTVAVHEFAFHPQNGEMVAATHGRSLWITDVSALRQIVPENIRNQVVLYKPGAAIRWRNEPSRGRTNRRFAGTNPPSGAQIYYSLPKKAERVALKIVDIEGATVREFRGVNEPGLQRVSWDLTRAQPRGQRPARGGREGRERSAAAAAGPASPERGRDAAAPPSVVPAQFSAGQPQPAASKGEAESRPAVAVERIPNEAPGSGTPAAQRPGRGRAGAERPGAIRAVLPGTYRVVLNVDGQELAQTIRVEADPNLPPSVAAEEEVIDSGGLAGEDEDEDHWIDD